MNKSEFFELLELFKSANGVCECVWVHTSQILRMETRAKCDHNATPGNSSPLSLRTSLHSCGWKRMFARASFVHLRGTCGLPAYARVHLDGTVRRTYSYTRGYRRMNWVRAAKVPRTILPLFCTSSISSEFKRAHFAAICCTAYPLERSAHSNDYFENTDGVVTGAKDGNAYHWTRLSPNSPIYFEVLIILPCFRC